MAVQHLAQGALNDKLCRHCNAVPWVRREGILKEGEGLCEDLQKAEMILDEEATDRWWFKGSDEGEPCGSQN